MRKQFLHKRISILLVFLLILTSPVNALMVFGNNTPINIIDEIVLKDTNGNVLDENTSVGLDDDVHIFIEWSINDNEVHAGDSFTMQIPAVFKINNEVTGELITNQEGVSAGQFHVSPSGLLNITFNNFVETHSLVSGEIQLKTYFNKDVLIKNNTNSIIFKINENTEFGFVIDFTPQNTTENIVKSYSVDAYNPTEMTWVIKVNKQLKKLSNVQIDDVLSAGQKLIPDSVEVYKLHVNLDGTDELTSKAYDNFTLNASSNLDSFNLTFNDSINDAYVIQYKTKMTDFKQKNFNNTATLTANGKTHPPVQVGYTIPKRHLLEKLAEYDSKRNEVTWKVLVNYREAPLGQVEVKDVLSEGQKFISDSFVVKEVTIDGAGNATVGDVVEPTAYIVQENGQGFSFFYNYESNSKKAFEITYKTTVTDSNRTSVKNTVSLWNNGIQIENYVKEISVAPVSVEASVSLEKKTAAWFNYKERLQAWEITFNSGGVALDANTTITDTFPDGGMQLIPESMIIIDESGDIINGDEYELKTLPGDPSWEKGFIVTFKSQITEKYTIWYQTKMIPATHTPSGNKIQFKNVAVMDTKTNGQDVSKEAVYITNMTERIVANGEKTGQYNYKDHSITWNILLNEDRSEINTPIIRDTISTDLKLVPESIEVYTVDMGYYGNYAKKKRVDSEMYDVVIENNELTLQFKKPISDRYIITYKTDIKDITQNEYTNTAIINDGEKELTQFSKTVKVPVANKYVSKSGTQNGNQIDWSLYINQSQSTVKNATLHDEPSLGQKVLVESIKVYEVDVDESGQIYTAHPTPIDDSLYDIKMDYDTDTGEESFDIVFKNTIDKIYLLEYSTQIVIASVSGTATLTNRATFSGDGVKEEHSTISSDIIVKITQGSGNANGVLGSLEVKKVDAYNKEPLKGATFTLYKNDVAIRQVTTDKEGMAVFNELLLGQYKLVETAAPEGYLLNNTSYDVTVNPVTQSLPFIVENKAIPKEPTPGDGETDSTPGDGETDSTPGDGETDSTPGDGETDSTPDDGETDSTPGDGETDSTPGNGETDSTPGDGETDSTPGNGETDSTPGNGETDSTPGDGETDSTPGDGETDSTPDDGETDLTPDDDVTDSTPGDGETDLTPDDDVTDSTPGDGETDLTPDDDVTDSTPGDGETSKTDGEEDSSKYPESGNDKDDKNNKLPQTGETFLRVIFLIGLFFVALSSVFLRKKSK